MTVVSKPVPTFKPSWLRKGNPSRGRRTKTWRGYYPCVTKFRRQPKGRRANSGQWFRREPSPVLLGPAVCETMRVHGWNHAWGVDYADRSNEP